jgi:hypothetical protein
VISKRYGRHPGRLIETGSVPAYLTLGSVPAVDGDLRVQCCRRHARGRHGSLVAR